jgi:hypothetical protein
LSSAISAPLSGNDDVRVTGYNYTQDYSVHNDDPVRLYLPGFGTYTITAYPFTAYNSNPNGSQPTCARYTPIIASHTYTIVSWQTSIHSITYREEPISCPVQAPN